MIRRWARFVAGSYPPVISVLFAFAWAYGVTGLFAAVQPHSPSWRPGVGTAVSAVTLTVTLLLMRAVDDIRDLDYDRRFNPKRPLASGAVHTRDLLVLCAAGSVVALAINIGNPAALTVLAVQLAYCMVVLAVDQWLHWPSGDNLLLSLLVSFPAQLLLHIYLYVRYLDSTALTAHRGGALAIVITVLATVHLEFAKKINRRLKPGERSYIEVFGFNGTVGIAVTAPLASVVLLLTGARTTAALVPLAILPLALPALAGWRFWRTPATTRWPPAAPAFYVLLTFACYFVLSLSYS